ncbi:MAG: hypothetical protein LBU17_10620 [Treponema sp.]|nr:hypothetical protein [Treponema sp.]
MLTEKDRRKPWTLVHNEETKKAEVMWQESVLATRFGLFTAAIWIFAIGLFFFLGFTMSFKFSWFVFVFAVAAQLLVQACMYKPDSGAEKN